MRAPPAYPSTDVPAAPMTTPPDRIRSAPPSSDEASVREWGAIYAYIRQSGRAPEEARDLTQGFIADVLLGRDLRSKLDERRGAFRTLLLSSVRNYLADRYRHDHAARRHPSGDRRHVGGDAIESGIVDHAGVDPERAFVRAWISRLVREAADAVREEALAGGREMAWDAFESRVLRPMLEGAEPPPYERIMARWGLDAPGDVANAIVSMRRAFARRFAALVGDTVDSTPASARAELRALLGLMEGRAP